MRLAVVSPFVDRQHGTERAIAEVIERFNSDENSEIFLYSQFIKDLRINEETPNKGRIIWRRIPKIPGPHLLQFVCWMVLNALWRWWDGFLAGRRFDLVFSPGINCLRPDATVVHALFHRVWAVSQAELQKKSAPRIPWFRRLHRTLYYGLLMFLEKKVYSNPRVAIAGVSQRTARLIEEQFGRKDAQIVFNGVDPAQFSTSLRKAMRETSRREWEFRKEDFVILLIGNDWHTKGLSVLLEAVAVHKNLPFRILVAGSDAPQYFEDLATQLGVRDRFFSSGLRSDVLSFYAAADVYASPSLEDAFALPPLEAMACGLPVITSVENGGSQIVTDSVDGFVLSNPHDSAFLAQLLLRLYSDSDLYRTMSNTAAQTAINYTWDKTAERTWRFLLSTIKKENMKSSVTRT